jgi:hypothetical protein
MARTVADAGAFVQAMAGIPISRVEARPARRPQLRAQPPSP